MYTDLELVKRAQQILREIAQGINPLTGEVIEETNFVNNPKMIRCFTFVADALERVNTPAKNYNTQFIITQEQKAQIELPFDTIGISKFAQAVNKVIDESISRRASANMLFNSLKTLGILGEAIDNAGRKSTITIPNSANFGFETERRVYNNQEYDQVVANRQGQKYLLDNLEMLMGESSI
ncbi:MAG: hypothetical protein WC155_06730 [Candidatus Cloacimonadales bacterium]